MTAKLGDLEGMPDWPPVLSREQAAAYVNLSPSKFDAAVRSGKYPAGQRVAGARIQWSRKALDEAVDRNFGLPAASPNPWDGRADGGTGAGHNARRLRSA